ncbi:FkbM family methyltransferase [Lysinibacillus sp. KU-BSD001]|uniref:FkbM family methyltransferase n=1 Tax=Lysinibacillus sp. KU-BSD001 TaxID=3141328 RepID=UPI0036F117D3
MLKEKLKLNIVQDDIVEDYLASIRENVNEIIVWGVGTANNYINFLQSNDLNERIKFYADNNKELQGTSINGKIVLSPAKVYEFYQKNPNILIVITSIYAHEVYKQLLSLGISKLNIDIKGTAIAYEIKNQNQRVILDNMDRFEEVYSILEDKHSQDLYVALLNSRLTYDNTIFSELSSLTKDQYFEPGIIEILPSEVFVDCGSFTGDTLVLFNERFKQYSKYIAIEADPINYQKLINNVVEKNIKNVQCENFACWDKEENLYFSSNLNSGKIESNGEQKIKAKKLDDILANEKISFLKMDIEGAEENALKGAENIIKRDQPILAICLYHSLEDFYKLPLLMKKFNDEYTFFIRHYIPMFNTETVCYAIPKNRI